MFTKTDDEPENFDEGGTEAIETTRIHGVDGRTGGRMAVVITRPLRAPRHP